MARMSKRQKLFKDKIDSVKQYKLEEATDILKDISKELKTKFTESVDLSINLGIDTRKSDQNVRGAVVLPHGTGKTVKVAVFAEGENAQKAKDAGADIVGFDDLAKDIKAGNMDFDVVIATPDAMRVVGQLGQILGPRGLMPNPKVGTVTTDVQTAVKNAKSGQVQYRADKGGIIHCTIGKISFESDKLKENLSTVIAAVKKAKPSSSKGTYIKKLSLSSTMGPGLTLDKGSIE